MGKGREADLGTHGIGKYFETTKTGLERSRNAVKDSKKWKRISFVVLFVDV